MDKKAERMPDKALAGKQKNVRGNQYQRRIHGNQKKQGIKGKRLCKITVEQCDKASCRTAAAAQKTDGARRTDGRLSKQQGREPAAQQNRKQQTDVDHRQCHV